MAIARKAKYSIINIEQLTKWVDAYQTAIGMADDKGLSCYTRDN